MVIIKQKLNSHSHRVLSVKGRALFGKELDLEIWSVGVWKDTYPSNGLGGVKPLNYAEFSLPIEAGLPSLPEEVNAALS